MLLKLYKDNNMYEDTISHVLLGRGIESDCIEPWIKAENPKLNTWHDLDNIQRAAHAVHDAVISNSRMAIVVDCDGDGYSSAAIFLNYLNEVNPEYAQNIHYCIHSGKQHGLGDLINELQYYDYIIAPDSSSNDYEEHKILYDKGKTIVVLDHHEAPYYSENAIIVNNQLSENYTNKFFSGAGIVYRFCQCYDELFGYNYANKFLDLVALGLISDMMSYQDLETRYIISQGLKNIHNPFLYYMIEKNDFSIQKKGGVNYNAIAWYVTPFINAVVRSGDEDEKILIFQSMLTYKAFEKIPSGKRGQKGELVPRVEEAVRIAANVKARQTKLQDGSMSLIEKKIAREHLLDEPILLLKCDAGEVEKNLAGLLANRLQAKYQRPAFVLIKGKSKEETEYFYRGSARNYSKSKIQNLRELCEGIDSVEYAQGQQYGPNTPLPSHQRGKLIIIC